MRRCQVDPCVAIDNDLERCTLGGKTNLGSQAVDRETRYNSEATLVLP